MAEGVEGDRDGVAAGRAVDGGRPRGVEAIVERAVGVRTRRPVVREREARVAATGAERDPHEFVPEESRRGRAVPVYAALRSLGRQGVADLIERCCQHASDMAARLRAVPGIDADAVLAGLGDPAVEEAYLADKRLARTILPPASAHCV